MKNKNEINEKLLQRFLSCRNSELQRLKKVLSIAEFFGVSINEILEHIENRGATPDFYNLSYSAVKLTLDKIIKEIENRNKHGQYEGILIYLRYGLKPFINYHPAYWSIDALDNLNPEKETIESVISKIIKEIQEKEPFKNGVFLNL